MAHELWSYVYVRIPLGKAKEGEVLVWWRNSFDKHRGPMECRPPLLNVNIMERTK